MINKITIQTTSYFRREFKSYEEDLIILDKENIAKQTNNFTKKLSIHLYPDSYMFIEVKENYVIIDFQAYLESMNKQGEKINIGEMRTFDEDNFTYDIEARHYVNVE